MGQLSTFLKEQKHLFHKDVAAHNIDRWTVVMGNEAGDLDTQASALAYSYITTSLLQQPTIALSRTARPDLPLRPENQLAFSRAQISPSDLLCIDDLPHPLPKFGRLALVDHNKLGPEFATTPEGDEKRVVAVIDHHDDEQLYPLASPRLIKPPTEAGSCTSLLTSHFRPLWSEHLEEVPGEVALLLLSTILIDTSALKPGGKAQQVDREAAEFLAPLAGFAQAGVQGLEQGATGELEGWYTELITKKFDVGGLGTRDLLRRDYKQYAISPASAQNEGGRRKLEVGLATVPLSLGKWVEKDAQIWEGVDRFLQERGLDAVGILTTYRSEGKGKHRRQICFFFSPGAEEGWKAALYEALEGTDVLQLEREEKKASKWGLEGGRGRVWQQGNVQATRKQVAPLVVGVCERYLGV